MINLFNVPSRLTKNEMYPTLRKLKNGYKMSRKARIMLGITDDTSCNLAIGAHGDALVIKATSKDEPNNALVSKLNMINSAGIVEKLNTFGNHFTITNEQVDGYYIMTASTVEDSNNDDEDDDELETAPGPNSDVSEEVQEDRF